MSNAEKELICDFLDELSNRMGNAGSNDMTMPDTLDNRAIVMAAHEDDNAVYIDRQGDILTTDYIIVDYLRRKLEQEISGEQLSS